MSEMVLMPSEINDDDLIAALSVTPEDQDYFRRAELSKFKTVYARVTHHMSKPLPQQEMTLEEFEATKPLMPLFVFAKYKGRWVEAVVGHRGGLYTYTFLGSNHVMMSECITHINVPRKPS